MKIVDVVRRVVEVASSLRERRRNRSAAIEKSAGVGPRERALGVAEVATLRFVQATTAVAKQMRHMPVPKPRPAEKLALSAAASQLRALSDIALSPEGDSPLDQALADLVQEALALVDRVLEEEPELPREAEPRALPERGAERGEGEPMRPIKVRF